MPHHEFLCHDCQKFFDKMVDPTDYEEGRNLVPVLRQQEHRAALGFPDSHIQKERVKPACKEFRMHFDKFSFGSIQIDGSTYEHDVVIDRGEVSKRKKKPSKKFRDEFGHTPLPSRKRYPGNVGNSSSAPAHTATCR